MKLLSALNSRPSLEEITKELSEISKEEIKTRAELEQVREEMKQIQPEIKEAILQDHEKFTKVKTTLLEF